MVYLYCARFWKDDKKYHKWIVVFVSILDLVHQAFCAGTMYTYLISHFYKVRPVTVTVMVEAVLAFIVQLFFARRVFLLNPKEWWLTVIVIFTSLLQLGFGSWCAATTKIDKTFDQYINPKNDVNGISQRSGRVLQQFCDLFITFGIIRGLRRSRTGFKTTDRGITNLITFTFSTGTISRCCPCPVSWLLDARWSLISDFISIAGWPSPP
ncbi:hypothetical protein BS47DRAFT_488073 [Hydnum rufescens UP504]|uniref:Uncharacterized protein n=1 Tax=Hydnum rufescens UP504 TaxID=1448309 RepID=A0A9P6AIB1_9AGAM|nr:hypothetical protein BS47DRAFT_488073 [Hydnum rufescens UP504]